MPTSDPARIALRQLAATLAYRATKVLRETVYRNFRDGSDQTILEWRHALSSVSEGAVKSERRLKTAIAGAVGGVLVIVAILRMMDLGSRRERTLDDAERRAAGLAHISSQYLRELVAVTDASLRQLAGLSPRIGGPAGPKAEWTSILSAARSGLTGIGSLTVTDADGVVRASTIESIVGQSRHEEYLFRRLAASTDDILVASTPFRTLARPPQLVIPLARRLLAGDGRFAGTVVATLIPAELRGFFRSIDVGRTGMVWVFHPEGSILIHEPSESDPIGETSRGNPIFEASRERRRGTVRASLAPDGPVMISAFDAEEEPALVVAVSLGQPEVLDEWRREVLISIAILAVTALMSATVVALLFREVDARSLAQQHAAAAETARQVAETRARFADELEQKNAELETFAYSVSHDLRSPLRGIDGFSKMLLDDYSTILDETARGYLDRVRAAAQRMGEMIDGLLALSRVSRSQVMCQPVNLSAIARGIADDLVTREPNRNVQFAIQDGLVVDADGKLMRIVLENLLGNAWKFTSKTPAANIEFGADHRQSELVYFVRDNGAGFDLAHRANLFRPFQRLHTERDFAGTGIGLATVGRAIERHGGRVDAESLTGHGATFFFTIPPRAAA